MTAFLKFTAAALLISLTTACSGSGGSGGGAGNTAFNDPETAKLNGTWKGSCEDAGGTSLETVLVISNGNVRFAASNYASNDCSGQAFAESTLVSSIVVSGTSSLGPDIVNVDLVEGSQRIKLKDQTLVDTFNASSFCGFTNWQVGVEKEVSGRECGGETIPTAGTRHYSIAQLQGNTMRMGDEDATHDGSSAEKRHAVLDTEVYTK